MQRQRRVDAVAETDMIEGDIAANGRKRRTEALNAGSGVVFRMSRAGRLTPGPGENPAKSGPSEEPAEPPGRPAC